VDTVPRTLVVKCGQNIAIEIPYKGQYFQFLNPLMDTLKPHSNGPLYNNTVNGTLAIDGWAVSLLH